MGLITKADHQEMILAQNIIKPNSYDCFLQMLEDQHRSSYSRVVHIQLNIQHTNQTTDGSNKGYISLSHQQVKDFLAIFGLN